MSENKKVTIEDVKECFSTIEEYTKQLKTSVEECILVMYDTNEYKFYHIKIDNEEDFYDKTSYIDGDCEGFSDSLWYNKRIFYDNISYKLISLQTKDKPYW